MIKNAYPDEKMKMDSEFENQLTVWMKIQNILDEHGYALDTSLENGLPVMELNKLD